MTTATWVQDELKQRGVPFQERHHPEAYTAQAVAQCEHVSGHRVAKVVVVIADGRPIELILPASRNVLLGRVREQLGVRAVRLATEEEMGRYFTDCEPGAMPALRHWKDADVWMDSSMKVDGDILFQAGTHCDAVCMGFDDWFNMVQPKVGAFSEPATPATPRSALAEGEA